MIYQQPPENFQISIKNVTEDQQKIIKAIVAQHRGQLDKNSFSAILSHIGKSSIT
jgi:hypothetical protein